ncbi:M23 family metallopeptidase [Cellulosimicrobium protaetiae]|uniref:M23 family metallopeptidase n=1 Tax=Cellulosimicrobium protaetiae TaxID=2587808 RepID=A0A6M5UH02_9MICO|nr:M23 family metallopeptidase [Cellulosimicrobium protaetiae]QJW36872.1 M23 family metallopeptidase [Cellulosimicrobium protaetiae]
MAGAVELSLPFTGTWLVQNSPARRVPSHGTHLFATTYAIDFVAVRGRRTAAVRDWRTALGTEPPGRFHAYGLPVLAPAPGTVVAVHDGEPDHEARRSPLALVGYALTQASRARAGGAALAGNHVVLALDAPRVFVVLAHLRSGSVAVRPGQRVATGDEVGRCGSSGNSTQPHVHVQVMDGPDPLVARGVPLVFRTFRERRRGGTTVEVARGVPAERAVVEPA